MRSIHFLSYITALAMSLSIVLINSPQSRSTETDNQDILFLAENKIWIFDEKNFTYKALPIYVGDAKLGDAFLSRNNEFIYYAIYLSDTTGEIHRYNLKNGVDNILFQSPMLSRISPPSPDDKYMIVSLVDFHHPEVTTVCIVDMMDDNDCQLIDANINFEYSYWLAFDKLITVLPNEIIVYELKPEGIIRKYSSYSADTPLQTTTITADKSYLILYSSGTFLNNYSQNLYRYKISKSAMDLISNIDLSELNAYISQLESSPNANFLAYTYAYNLVITDFLTGNLSIETTDVQNFKWLSNDNILLSDTMKDGITSLSIFDIKTKSPTVLGEFTSHIAFVRNQ